MFSIYGDKVGILAKCFYKLYYMVDNYEEQNPIYKHLKVSITKWRGIWTICNSLIHTTVRRYCYYRFWLSFHQLYTRKGDELVIVTPPSPRVILPQFSHKTRPYISVSFGQSKLVRFRFNLTVRAILIDKMDTVTSITSTKNHSAIIN